MQHNRFRHLPQHRLAFKGVLDYLLPLVRDDNAALLGRRRVFILQISGTQQQMKTTLHLSEAGFQVVIVNAMLPQQLILLCSLCALRVRSLAL